MKRRFFIIDPSFTSHEGDRWQYAIDLAKSAHEEGFDCVLMTHRSAPLIQSHLDFPIRQLGVFEHTFYNHGAIYARHREHARPLASRRRAARYKERLERIDKAIGLARERSDLLRVATLERRKVWLTRLSSLVSRLADLWESRRRPRPFNRDDFALGMAKVFRDLPPGPSDRLFFHTMTYGMMESLAELTAARGHAAPFDTDAYFLFHFGAEAPDARTYLDRYYSYSAYGSIGDRLRVGSPFTRLHFLATSEILCEEAATILGGPVSLWHGLVDMRRVVGAVGDGGVIAERRTHALGELCGGRIRALVRAADLDAGSARAVSRACHLLQHRGNVVHLRVVHHRGSMPKLREILAHVDFPNLELVDTENNDDYVRELAEAAFVFLPYDRTKYEKRVSAVLHDCAVMGVPAIVPSGSTLADCDFATVFVYHDNDDLLGAALNAVRALARDPDLPNRTIDRAIRLLATNAVARLVECSPRPSIEVHGAAPIANVIMPLWGRVGSSFAMEAQIRYLLERGYFVNQVFLIANPVEPAEAFEYFWRILRENARHVRGCVQRVAFWDEANAGAGRSDRSYLAAGAFDQFQRRIARNVTEDPRFDADLLAAEVTIVNHSFNTEWAFDRTAGKRVLETHDIQSHQMVNWPLIDEGTLVPDGLPRLLASELRAVRRYDHVVNVAPDEHMILSQANPRSSLVTPYLPPVSVKGAFASVADMGSALGWHESYRWVDTFDLLLIGDSHPANRESAIWFIKNVFTPLLAPRGITLAIVGRLSKAVHDELRSVPYLYYVGFVDDIDSVKALSRIAVLPDQRGTGISIKTLEAFATAMPFVGTAVAFRGLRDRLPEDCRAYDQPEEMAQEIIRALEDPDHRAELSRLASRCYAAVAGKEQFTSAWNAVFDALGLRAPTPTDALPAPPEAPHP